MIYGISDGGGVIRSVEVGGVLVEVVAGDWWLGERNVLTVLRRDREYEDGAGAWALAVTMRWRGWVRREVEGTHRGRRGVFLGQAGAPDFAPAA